MFKYSKLIFCFVCLAYFHSVFAAQYYTTLLTVDVIRHGDRTPIITIPNAPHQWREGLGQLTAKGMHQLCQLGTVLREQYINQRHLLPLNYFANTLFVRSTDYDRTLMSANALLACLYPPRTGPKLESGQFALPDGFQPIPIHTVQRSNDELLNPFRANEKLFNELLERYVYSQITWIEKEKEVKLKLQQWSKASGYKIDSLKDIISLGDALYIQEIYQLPVPSMLSKQDIEEIIALAQWTMVQKFKPSPIGKFAAKEFLSQLKKDIDASITRSSTLKSFIYLCHDSTILGFLSALGISLNNIPSYGADLRFELLEDGQKHHWIRVSYNGNIQKLPNCNGLCSLKQFLDLM